MDKYTLVSAKRIEQKALANGIRHAKYNRELDPKELAILEQLKIKPTWLHALKYEYRHRHITYCLFRGRTMEQIERSNRQGHEPSESYLEQLAAEYNQLLEQDETDEATICAS